MTKRNNDKIVKLTDKWYYYVNLDHHKTRDCIWNIEISYKYGDEPKYMAYHHGYVIDTWYSPECDTLEDAEMWLINKLERELEKAREHLEDIVRLPDGNEEKEWVDPSGRAKEVLEYLNG